MRDARCEGDCHIYVNHDLPYFLGSCPEPLGREMTKTPHAWEKTQHGWEITRREWERTPRSDTRAPAPGKRCR